MPYATNTTGVVPPAPSGRTAPLRRLPSPAANGSLPSPAAPTPAPAPGHRGRAELEAALRGRSDERASVDPGLAGGLREWLEDGVAPVAADLAVERPLVVTARALRTGGVETPPGPEDERRRARGALVRALFRQVVVTGRIGSPMADALAALEVDGRDAAIGSIVRQMPAADRRALAHEVTLHADHLADCWTALPGTWLPRTRQRLAVPLAGGRMVLAGTVDLVVGAAPVERSSVCLVQVTSAERRPEHHEDLLFHALLETVRSGAPPCRVATFSTATGQLHAEPVTEDQLAATVRRCIAAACERARSCGRGDGRADGGSAVRTGDRTGGVAIGVAA